MSRNLTHFNDAMKAAAQIIADEGFPDDDRPLVIRDIRGRIRIILNYEKGQHADQEDRIATALARLGAFKGGDGSGLLYKEDFFDPDTVFDNPDVLDCYLADIDTPVRLLDRQVVGQDWLRATDSTLDRKPQRIVFFGLKGGVGRSTALAILAYKLAKDGQRVLLVDFDLESPGLSGLLLPPDRLAEFGMVDWFVEDAVGQGDRILKRMISVSPLSEYTEGGEIRVAAAMGLDEGFYLPKLSRVYADLPGQDGVERFSQRAARLITALEEQEQPDVVLIDSRAGLHDLAAISIVGLSSTALLFATDSDQSWQGYRLLFSHWRTHPEVLKALREKLVLIEALFPETDQQGRSERFLERAYDLFTDMVYEPMAPDLEPNSNVFNFDMKDQSAPHFPLRIKWNNRFQEFSPLLLLPDSILSDADIEASFGHFLDGIRQLLGGDGQ